MSYRTFRLFPWLKKVKIKHLSFARGLALLSVVPQTHSLHRTNIFFSLPETVSCPHKISPTNSTLWTTNKVLCTCGLVGYNGQKLDVLLPNYCHPSVGQQCLIRARICTYYSYSYVEIITVLFLVFIWELK